MGPCMIDVGEEEEDLVLQIRIGAFNIAKDVLAHCIRKMPGSNVVADLRFQGE